MTATDQERADAGWPKVDHGAASTQRTVGDVIADGLNRWKASGTKPKRHRAEVTADRLTNDVTRWADKMDGSERDDFGRVIQVLREIADGDR